MGSGLGLLPDWLRLLWVAAFAGTAAVHLAHARAMGGQRRTWHATHVLVALGMVAMYLPMGARGGAAAAWEVVFGVGGAGLLAWMVASSRPVNGLWVLSAIELAAMVYMFALSGTAFAALSYGLAGYFAVEALGWTAPVLGDTARWQGAVALPASGGTAPTMIAPLTLADRASVGLRASLAVMSLGMTYMFVAMQAGH